MIVRRNDAARQLHGHPEYIYRVGIAIPLINPDGNGFPSNEEMEVLVQIEDALCEAIESNKASLMVLVITTNGMREFLFYTRAPQFVESILASVRALFTSHELQFYIQEDRNWEWYEIFSRDIVSFSVKSN